MTNYVAGFLINDRSGMVALVRKLRPHWQAGKLNAIGGHIEEGETALEAMIREFREETGAEVTNWRPFAVLNLPNAKACVHFFEARGHAGISTKTDETVDWYEIREVIRAPNVLPNLRWLLPLALDKDGATAVITDLSIPGAA